MAPHLELVDEEIRKLVTREVPERVLVVRMPPRHGKSELVSRWAPAWFEANWPDKNVLLASYEADYAADWGRKARDEFARVTGTPGCILPGRGSSERQAVANWGTTAGGYMATAGVGGPFTGKGFHLGICDDLIKNSEQAQSETYRRKTWEWFTSTFWTRREPEGVLIVIGTPWHRDDYLARLRDWEEPVRELCLPARCESTSDPLKRPLGAALWPERYDERELAKIEAAQGPYYWQALYQGRPSQHEQAEWPADYFAGIFVDRMPPAFEVGAVGGDPSKGKHQDRGDYSGISFAGICGGVIYVDSIVRRMPAEQFVIRMAEMTLKYKAECAGIEAVQFQELLAGDLDNYVRRNRLPAFEIIPIENTTPKPIRIRRIGPWLAQKRLRFLDTPDNRLLVDQLKDFPLGDHDDGPDGLEMAIRLLAEMLAMAGGAYDMQVETV